MIIIVIMTIIMKWKWNEDNNEAKIMIILM